MAASGSVPTLTIGGFLGAGKTTLVNHLLKGANGARVVVFVNDFGAINIDHDLIETVEKDRIALSNGCVCCTLNDDLVRAMAGFCESDPPDLFAIEASGVADPRSLSATLNALQQSGLAHLRHRIYVLDAEQFGGLDYANTEDLVDHAAASDLIIINKSDLVTQERLEGIERLLSRSAPKAARKVTSHGQVSFAETLQSPGQDPAGTQPAGHDASALFSTVSYDNIPPLSADHFAALVRAMKDTCLRAKGVLYLDDPNRPAVRVQLVGRRLEQLPLTAQDKPQARLVTIGWSGRHNPTSLSSILGVEPLGRS